MSRTRGGHIESVAPIDRGHTLGVGVRAPRMVRGALHRKFKS